MAAEFLHQLLLFDFRRSVCFCRSCSHALKVTAFVATGLSVRGRDRDLLCCRSLRNYKPPQKLKYRSTRLARSTDLSLPEDPFFTSWSSKCQWWTWCIRRHWSNFSACSTFRLPSKLVGWLICKSLLHRLRPNTSCIIRPPCYETIFTLLYDLC